MRFFSYVFSFSFLAVILLSGCRYYDDPSPMGRGYVSYNEAYKSAPGPEARDVGYDFSTNKNEAVLKEMRFVARNLVENLDKKLSFSIDSVFLKKPADTAFYGGLDHLIREELTANGYQISTVPENAVELILVAKKVEVSCQGMPEPQGLFYVALAWDVVKNIPGEFVGDIYTIPYYDFVPAGHIKIDVPCASPCCDKG